MFCVLNPADAGQDLRLQKVELLFVLEDNSHVVNDQNMNIYRLRRHVTFLIITLSAPKVTCFGRAPLYIPEAEVTTPFPGISEGG